MLLHLCHHPRRRRRFPLLRHRWKTLKIRVISGERGAPPPPLRRLRPPFRPPFFPPLVLPTTTERDFEEGERSDRRSAFTAIYRSISYVDWIRGGFSRVLRFGPVAPRYDYEFLRNETPPPPFAIRRGGPSAKCASRPLLFEEGILQSSTSDARRAVHVRLSHEPREENCPSKVANSYFPLERFQNRIRIADNRRKRQLKMLRTQFLFYK